MTRGRAGGHEGPGPPGAVDRPLARPLARFAAVRVVLLFISDVVHVALRVPLVLAKT